MLDAYELTENDLAPLKNFLSELPDSGIFVVQNEYSATDYLDIDFFESARTRKFTPDAAVKYITTELKSYMNSNGIALPPGGYEDIIFYSLKS